MNDGEKEHEKSEETFEEVSRTNTQKKSSGRKYIFAAIIFLFIIIGSLVFTFYAREEPDYIIDAVVRKLVSEQLDKNPKDLTDEDFAKVKNFSLAGFSFWTNPSSGTLFQRSSNTITVRFSTKREDNSYINFELPIHISFLSKLGIKIKNRKYLFDLRMLEKLSNLQNLNLSSANITNINSIGKLNQLEALFISKAAVRNLEQFKGLTKLHILGLQETMIDNIETLSNFTELSSLDISSNKVSDIEPLRKLTKLQYLHLENNPITNIEPLEGLMNITSLYLDGTLISDLEPLKNLSSLSKLSLVNCKNLTLEQVEDLQETLPYLEIFLMPGYKFEGI
jgi:Leucine-rich repeat (LRR) protein